VEVAQGEAEEGTIHSGTSRHPIHKPREIDERTKNLLSTEACKTQSLGPHLLHNSDMADAVDDHEHKIQQSFNFQAVAHYGSLDTEGSGCHIRKTRKRSAVQLAVEERSDVRRAKRRDGGSNESKLSDTTVKEGTMASRSFFACLAEDQHQKRQEVEQRCFQKPQEECGIPFAGFSSPGYVQLNAKETWGSTKNVDLEADGPNFSSESNSARFAYAQRDLRALQLHLTGETNRSHSTRTRATRLNPLGSTGDDTVVVLQRDPPSVAGHCHKIAMLERSAQRHPDSFDLARWQRLLAPDALQMLFPTKSIPKQETTYVEGIPALTASNLDLDVESGLHWGAGNVKLAQETATQPTKDSETQSADKACHFDRTVSSSQSPTNTQHLPSSHASSQHEANLDQPLIYINPPDISFYFGGKTMASEERTTGAPPRMADASTVDASCSLANDQDLSLEQPLQPDEELETVEDICQKLGLTLDEADKWLEWMMQRWREGYCMPSCTGECSKCPKQQNDHTAKFASPPLPGMQADNPPSNTHTPGDDGAGSATGQASTSEAPDPQQTALPGNIQMLSQRHDTSSGTVQAEGTGTAISNMFLPAGNEATIEDIVQVDEGDAEFDISEYFDVERFDKDNEEGNLHWTGRTY